MLALVTCWLAAACLYGSASHAEPRAAQPIPLQLEIFIDDRPAHVIGAFLRLPDGRMSSERRELREVGIAAPGSGPDNEPIVLDAVPGLTYRYDETRQTIHLTAPLNLRSTHDYDGQSAALDSVPVQSATGLVLNYDLFTSALRSPTSPGITYQGGSATLDGRFFTQFGTLNQTAILGSTTSAQVTALRLETNFTYSSPNSLTVYKAGDTITSGLGWTRPLRMGGLQMQRNFALRPDLVTLPLPSVSGSAAVPSTLDVYVNNIRTFSQEVDQGPYRINNLPLVGGDGTARVVLRDASGHEIEQKLPFYSSARLLKPGLLDYSVEAGFPRHYFGVKSDDYSSKFVANGSLRRGIFDWLTLESHAEAGAGLYNGSVGAVTRVFNRGALTTALAASHSHTGNGMQTYAAFDTRMFGIGLNVSSQRSFGVYDDLASVTAAVAPTNSSTQVATGGNSDPYAIRTSIRPPRAQDRISLSLPLPFDRSTSVGMSLINQRDSQNLRSRLVSMSISRNLPYRASAYATAYTDLIQRKQAGVYFGLSVPIGDKISSSVGASTGRNGWNATADVSRALGRETGDYGWRVRGVAGRGQTTYEAANLSYRSPYGRLEVNGSQQSGTSYGSAGFDGSFSWLGGGIHAANRIDDSFAVVDVGVPNVDVLYENRRVGKTDSRGQLLIPELRSFQRNKIEIDPRGLPVNSDAPTTQNILAPADRSGVLVDFKVKTNVAAAVVILRDKAGKDLPAGATGKLDGGTSAFVVGYDGRSYVPGLARNNRVLVDLGPGKSCTATFDFVAQPNTQVTIGPVVCQ